MSTEETIGKDSGLQLSKMNISHAYADYRKKLSFP